MDARGWPPPSALTSARPVKTRPDHPAREAEHPTPAAVHEHPGRGEDLEDPPHDDGDPVDDDGAARRAEQARPGTVDGLQPGDQPAEDAEEGARDEREEARDQEEDGRQDHEDRGGLPAFHGQGADVGSGLVPGDGEGVAAGFGKSARARIRTTSSPTNVSRLKRTATVTFSFGK